MLCLYYFLKFSFMSTLSSRGAAWDLRKRIYPRRVFGQLSHKFPPASAKLYQVWSKIISTKPNVHSRTVLRALSFLSKSLQFTTFFPSWNLKQFWNKALHSRLKKTKQTSVLSYNTYLVTLSLKGCYRHISHSVHWMSPSPKYWQT